MATQPPLTAAQLTAATPLTREELLTQLLLLCNGPGERRDFERWPVDLQLEAWLQLDGDPAPPIPVDLLDLSSGGVQVVLAGPPTVWPGRGGVLITETRGGGCGSRRVECRWQRPHPELPLRQCLGLAFARSSGGTAIGGIQPLTQPGHRQHQQHGQGAHEQVLPA